MDTSNWIPVNNKKTSATNKAKEKLAAMKTAMKKTKISIVIRIPNDADKRQCREARLQHCAKRRKRIHEGCEPQPDAHVYACNDLDPDELA